MMQFAPEVTWRRSRRGLVVCGPGESPLLVEHAHAGVLPELITEARDRDHLAALLGGSSSDGQLVADLIEERILADGRIPAVPEERTRRLAFTRSGLEVSGIDTVARWVHQLVSPVVNSWLGRLLLISILVGGLVSLLAGRPNAPQVSAHPWMDATLGLAISYACAALHELAHAVTLVHYGRSARRAGCGFYWGSLCFYVDCSDGITLPRRARVINALAGLGVEIILVAILLIAAQLSTSVLLVSVCWRVAILTLLGILENALPILEVDGHVALSDYLDEPDLGPRAREALSRKLRRIPHNDQPSWLATYGAVSVIGGILLLITGTWIWWSAAGSLITSLFDGNLTEILLGLLTVVPFAVGTLFSLAGLAIELVATPRAECDRAAVD